LVRQVRELTVQALLGVEPGDSALLRVEVHEAFLRHLAACGLPPARIRHPPDLDRSTALEPFGWNAEAMELDLLSAHPTSHPPLDVVRRVNARSFGLEVERELEGGELSGSVVSSLTELEAFLAGAPADGGWVVKAEHGNSGMANRRIEASGLAPSDRRFVERRFSEDDRLVVEPWRERERDWCVVFEVPFDPAGLRIHETVCTRDGALIGALFDPAGCEAVPWAPALSEAAASVAHRLGACGYFGPACFDAFSWHRRDGLRLRRLADLNCRRSMSHAAHDCWRRIAPDRFLFYRFFNRRKLRLPDSLPATLEALGERRYHRGGRLGILLASPLQVGEGTLWWSPNKLAVAFVAVDRAGCFALERRFREDFEG